MFLIAVAIIYFLFSETLVGLFTDDPAVISVGGLWLRIVSYSYFVYAWWMVATQAFNGAGDTITPTKINLVFFWLIQIPLSYVMAKQFGMGYSGVFWAIMISETSVGLFTLWLFTRGKWKRAVV
jgi:Na+-driven multidrug efflux pump